MTYIEERKTYYEGVIEGFNAIQMCKPSRQELEEFLDAFDDGLTTFNRGRIAAYREYLAQMEELS